MAGHQPLFRPQARARSADLILVLDQGTILERGTHAERLRQYGCYAQFIESQLATGAIKAGEHDAPQLCRSRGSPERR